MRQNQSIIKYDACDHRFADVAEATGRKPNGTKRWLFHWLAPQPREKLK
jgi:hypothetical protein